VVLKKLIAMKEIDLNKDLGVMNLNVQISMREFTTIMFLKLAKRELNKDEYILTTYYYSKLLTLTIHLGLFVHTNGKNLVIKKPVGYEKWLAKHRPSDIKLAHECLEYYYADKKIVYDGFGVVDDIKESPFKTISIDQNGFYISIGNDIQPVYIEFGSKKTIVEHLEFMDLKLSKTAINQIFN
jgi:hypothetical protein